MNDIIAVLLLTALAIPGISQFDPATRLDGEQLYVSGNTDIEGNPYLFDEMRFGELITINGDTLRNIKLNYNGISQRWIADTGIKDQLISLNFFHYAEICFADTGTNYINAGSMGDPSYMKVIYEDDDYAVYEKFTAEKTRTDNARYASVKSMYKIRKNKELFIYMDNTLTRVNRKLKDIGKLLDCPDIKDIARKQKLDIKSDSDFASILKLCKSD